MADLKQHQQPTVSVIMPAYNAERFIEEAIRSVMDQTYTDWELLVIDDSSKDATCAIVERLAEQDKRITLLRNEVNMGVARTRNRGFDLCKGRYVALLDSDDVWYPRKLERQLELAESTKADVIYCSYQIVDAQGQSVCDDFIVPPVTDFDDSLIKTVISCSTALLSRGIVDTYRFVTDYYHEDLVLWLQLLRDGCTARGVTEILAQYRFLEGTRSSGKVRSAINRWRIYRDYLNLPLLKSAVLITRYALLGLKKYSKSHS